MENEPIRSSSRHRRSNLRAFNQKWVEKYDSRVYVRLWTKRWDEQVIKELPDDMSDLRVLDIGCATGRLLESLAKTGAKNLAGTDIAPNILKTAEKKLARTGTRPELKVADAEEHLPWPDESFDVATLTGVLHHFVRPMHALREIRRVLRPKGRFIIIEPWLPLLIRLPMNLYLRFFTHDGDYRFYSRKGIVKLLDSAAFKELRCRRAPWHSLVIVGTAWKQGRQSPYT